MTFSYKLDQLFIFLYNNDKMEHYADSMKTLH